MNKLIKFLMYLIINLFLIIVMLAGLLMILERNRWGNWGFVATALPLVIWVWGSIGFMTPLRGLIRYFVRKGNLLLARKWILVLCMLAGLFLYFATPLGLKWALPVAVLPWVTDDIWLLVELIHSRWWSALVFWAGLILFDIVIALNVFLLLGFWGATKPYKPNPNGGFSFSNFRFSRRKSGRRRRRSDGISSAGLPTYGGIDDAGNTW